MSTIRRAGRDDTGENDVRELRSRRKKDCPTLPVTNEPYVRHKEDVPHESSLPDFYGLHSDGIDEELSELVDAGELRMGWDSERQEAIYWFADEDEQEEQPEPASQRSRRAKKPRTRRVGYRRVMVTLVASVAPFFVGMTAEAAIDMHRERHHWENPEAAIDEVPEPVASASEQTEDIHPTASEYQSEARHAKVATPPTVDKPKPAVEKPQPYVGKHRKALHEDPMKHHHLRHRHHHEVGNEVKKAESVTSDVTRPLVGSITKMSHLARSAPPVQAPETPAEVLVSGVMGPVEHLLG